MKIGFDQSMSKVAIIRVIGRVIFFIGTMFAIVFISAGRWNYWNGWIFWFLNIYVILFNFIIIPTELVKERSKPGSGTKKWDYIFHIIHLPLIYITPLIAALDGGRYYWSEAFSLWVILLAFVFVFLGYSLEILSLWTNQFFSTRVRIQTDRGHHVIDKGPYSFIRHPGYIGGIVSHIGLAIGLNSLWALIPAGLYVCLIIIRTFLEDDTLKRELPGYIEYSGKVKYRLFPGIW